MTLRSTMDRVSAPTREHPVLRRLVAVPIDTFAAEYWGREPLVSRAADLTSGAAEIFDNDAVDELVSRRGLRAPFLRVAKGGTTFGDGAFTDGGGVGAAVADQVSDDKLLRLFAEGATLVLQGLHRTWGPLIEFTQSLAAELGHPVQANAYVTPAQNTGFSDHYDVHDVFVIQVCGEKTWRVRPPVHPAPLRDQPWTAHRASVEAAAAAAPLMEFTLRPGDCLYLPRGYLHSATALGGVSTHLTLGVHVWTRRHLADALVALALDVASEDEEVRSSLAALVDVSNASEIAADVDLVREAVIDAIRDVDTELVAARLRSHLRAAERPAPVAPVAQTLAAADVDESDLLLLRRHLAPSLTPRPDGGATVHSRASDVVVTASEVPCVSTLLSEQRMTAGELGLDLARRLLLAGIVVYPQHTE